MSTIPSQQRAWSLLAGIAVSAGVYVAAQRELYKSAARIVDSHSAAPKAPERTDPEPLLPSTLASDAAATWNGAVDATLGPAVRALAKRGL